MLDWVRWPPVMCYSHKGHLNEQCSVESANLDTFLNEEFIEMTFDLEAKSMYTFRRIGCY